MLCTVCNLRSLAKVIILMLVVCNVLALASSSHCTALGNFTSAKTLYRIYGMPSGDVESWLQQYAPTFQDFLNLVVGYLFSPPITFTLVPTDTTGMFEAAESREADFTFTSPNIFGCAPPPKFQL